jgi:hypothetical protein
MLPDALQGWRDRAAVTIRSVHLALRDKGWPLFETLKEFRQPLDLDLEGAHAFRAAAMRGSGGDQAARRTQPDQL